MAAIAGTLVLQGLLNKRNDANIAQGLEIPNQNKSILFKAMILTLLAMLMTEAIDNDCSVVADSNIEKLCLNSYIEKGCGQEKPIENSDKRWKVSTA